MIKKSKYIYFSLLCFFCFISNAFALTGTVNVNDSLTLRSTPSTSGTKITHFYNNTELEILDLNAGSGNGCSKWYKVTYGGYTGYSCGDYITVKQENTSTYQGEDDSYSKENYSNAPTGDGTIMCYEDIGSLSLRNTANGNRTGTTVNCGDNVNILATEEKPNTTCPYWYKIKTGNNTGYVCGYYVNTTKLSSSSLPSPNESGSSSSLSSSDESDT